MSLNFQKKNKLTIAISMAVFSMGLSSTNMVSAQESQRGIASGQESKKDTVELDEPEVIEVRGIYSSLKEAAQIKRYEDTVVDVITSEDIGEFADDSIAGAIQRIPGVQIETDDAGTDGDRVSIRGLGPEFVNSTINGRRLLSSGNEGRNLRKMNFNAFPPSVLSGVKVTKGSTASRPESGLAGQIDLETIKPLDVRKLKNKNISSTVGIRAGLNDIDDETGFRVNALSVFRNDDNNLGGFFALVASDEKNARDQARINWGENYEIAQELNGNTTETTGVRAPRTLTLNPIRENPTRLAFATGVQYQPNADVDINWDLMFSNYNNKSTRNQFQININQNQVWRGAEFSQSEAGSPGIVIDENNAVRYADFSRSNVTRGLSARSTATVFDNETENLVSGINVDWLVNDSLSANFDAYVSTLDYTQDLRFVRFEKTLDPTTFIYDGTGSIPTITAPDADIIDGWGFSRTSVRQIDTEGENFGVTAAFNYDTDQYNLISSIDFGIHFDRTDIDSKRSGDGSRVGNDGANSPDGFSDEIFAAAFTGDRLPEEFLSGEGLSPSRYFVPNYSAAVAIDPRIANNGFDELGVDPLQSYEMVEDIFALYAQVNLDSEIFGLPVTGNVGMRAVYTDNEATALQALELTSGDISEEVITTNNDYWRYLPSLNLNFAIADNMALRLGLSRTMSRPDYQDTAPINRIRLDNDNGVDNSATVGNPSLRPMSSENLDVTFEWYNEYEGAFILSGFYKEIDDYIIRATVEERPLTGFEGLFDLTTNINFSEAKAEGFEIGLLQPLEKLVPALAGLGFSVNYTYVDSEFDEEDVGDSGFGLPGSSKDNFNFIGFYEAEFYSIRLAYTYRGSFFRSLSGTGSQASTTRFSGEQEKLNLNLGFKPMKNVSVKLSANNLTDEKRRDFFGEKSTFLDFFDRGRTYSVSVKYKF